MSFMLGILCMLCMFRIVHIPSIGTPVLPFIHALSICEYGDVLPTSFAATYVFKVSFLPTNLLVYLLNLADISRKSTA